MRLLNSRFINQYVNVPGVFMPFQPVLYVFIFVAVMRIGLHEPPLPFQERTGLVYEQWLGLSLAAPVMALIGLVLVHFASGRLLYSGLWLRLGGSVGTFLSMLAFQIASAGCGCVAPQVDHYYRYVTGSVLFYLLIIVIPRDVISLMRTEWAAMLIERHRRNGHGL